MGLVELALAQPENQRESYLENACSGNPDLFSQAWNYVQWETRMHGFLLEPLCRAAEDEKPFEPGQLLESRFRIEREVARGGMGIVYEAFDEKLDRRIALKCAKSGFGKRLPPEVRHASEISHPNVCKIFEIHTASTPNGEIDFLTMEFLEGETLATRLGRGRLPDAEARTIAMQICAGLAEAHRDRVVHGDLKSNNVILSKDAGGGVRAVITDFGLAHATLGPAEDIPFGASQAGGTPDYMAPELWTGEKPTAASDVYALGVILCELASGQRPSGADIHIGRKWDRLVARCLDPEPGRRFPNADEVRKALAPRSRRWWFAAAAAAVVTIGSVALTYQDATAPGQTVRLAILPFGPADLSRDTAEQLARLKGNSATGLKVIPLRDTLKKNVNTVQDAQILLGATHVLRGTVDQENENVILTVHLTDARSGVDKKDWKVLYKPAELRYAPIALAGFVTDTLELPPLLTNATVNSAARQDYRTGLSYVRENIRLDEAVTLMEHAVAADPDSPLTYAGLAEAQWARSRETGAPALREQGRASAREAQIRNPDLAEVHLISGWINFVSGLNEQARVDYLRAIALQPKNSEAYRRLTGVYERNGHLNEALAAAQKAVDIEPGNLRIQQNLGNFYFLRGDLEHALPPYRKMVELAPNSSAPHRTLGAGLGKLGRYEEAEQELRKAISLDDNFDTELTLGSVLLDDGKNQEAISCFERAKAIGPEDGGLWLDLGLAYDRERRPRDAKTAFFHGQAFTRNYLARDSRTLLERARLAYFEARLGDSQQALSDIGQALQTPREDDELFLVALLTYEVIGLRPRSLDLLEGSSSTLFRSIMVQAERYPELAGLRREPRYMKLVDSNHVRNEKGDKQWR